MVVGTRSGCWAEAPLTDIWPPLRLLWPTRLTGRLPVACPVVSDEALACEPGEDPIRDWIRPLCLPWERLLHSFARCGVSSAWQGAFAVYTKRKGKYFRAWSPFVNPSGVTAQLKDYWCCPFSSFEWNWSENAVLLIWKSECELWNSSWEFFLFVWFFSLFGWENNWVFFWETKWDILLHSEVKKTNKGHLTMLLWQPLLGAKCFKLSLS